MTHKSVTVTLELSERALRLLKFEAEGHGRTLDEHIALIVEDRAQFDLCASPRGFRVLEGELYLDGIPF